MFLLSVLRKNKTMIALVCAILLLFIVLSQHTIYRGSDGFATTNSPPSGPFSKTCKGYMIGNGSINGGSCKNLKGDSVNNSSFSYANCPLLSVANKNGVLQCGS